MGIQTRPIEGCISSMNERIKKLAEQAGFQYIKDEGIGCAGNHNASLPKFAKLIIQECANLFEVEWGEEKLTGNDVGYVVKKHFGVEQ